MQNTFKNIVATCFSYLLTLAAMPMAHADNPVLPAGTAAAPAVGQPSPLGALVPFGLMFLVIYFLMIRPQQKKLKEQQEMIGGLKQGDDVVTNSGLLGKITAITEKVVTIEVADKVRVKVLKTQVGTVLKGSIKDLEESAVKSS